MKLINADEIRYTCLEDGFGRIKEYIAFSQDIERQSTVEAIPIEWIEEWGWKNGMSESMSLKVMIEDWKKENETDQR